ncbi:MAG: LysM peptidoglycan-binding domain-containing protein [Chryseobacterium sp.]|jgi:hypothetical protein|uniref:LysM domain-containing protein n=1 Tax=Chryseobacterium sp. TaxID=1871047 RepID=UPI00282B82CE|nr:LysM domain-containing protein [Chryseobacterium sp.]MDR2238724.1 LysM peptidoglycan-binding domain-containing protein [Chryseobacterium sp.]
MESSFIKYQVKPKDSLSSIALRMNMSVYDLKEFHNQHCGKMDKLWFENLTGVKFILIPVSYVSQNNKQPEKYFEMNR